MKSRLAAIVVTLAAALSAGGVDIRPDQRDRAHAAEGKDAVVAEQHHAALRDAPGDLVVPLLVELRHRDIAHHSVEVTVTHDLDRRTPQAPEISQGVGLATCMPSRVASSPGNVFRTSARNASTIGSSGALSAWPTMPSGW